MKKALDSIKSALVILLMAGSMGVAGCTKTHSSLEENRQSEPRISESELRAYCPRLTLPESQAFYTVYERGGEGDVQQIIYQVAISDITRACRYDGGQIIMEVAAAGRVVPGPKFKPSNLKVPFYVQVMRSDETLYDKKQTLEVNVAQTGLATQFLFKDESVIFEQPTQRNIRVLVGFHRPAS